MECPDPPEEIKEWLENDWKDIDKELLIKQTIEKIEYELDDDDNEIEKIVTVSLEEDKDRVESLEVWKELREKWIESESKARKVDSIFNDLYSLYSILKKEAESVELVFGDGILNYKGKKQISHPLLIQTVNLEFDANIPQFKITISEERGPELYKSLFSNIEDTNYELLLEIYNEFEQQQFSPYELLECNSFLTRLSHAISVDGVFLESIQQCEEENKQLQIYRRPVLFVRKRNLGFEVAIDSIIEDIDSIESMPRFLCDIVGSEYDNINQLDTNNDSTNNFLSANGIDEDILLTKPANLE